MKKIFSSYPSRESTDQKLGQRLPREGHTSPHRDVVVAAARLRVTIAIALTKVQLLSRHTRHTFAGRQHCICASSDGAFAGGDWLVPLRRVLRAHAPGPGGRSRACGTTGGCSGRCRRPRSRTPACKPAHDVSHVRDIIDTCVRCLQAGAELSFIFAAKRCNVSHSINPTLTPISSQTPPRAPCPRTTFVSGRTHRSGKYLSKYLSMACVLAQWPLV